MMKRSIFFVAIAILFIFNIICIIKITKTTNAQKKIFHLYENMSNVQSFLINNISDSFKFDDQKMKSDIFLYTDSHDSIHISNVFKNGKKLIFRYTVGSCESCVDQEIEYLQKIFAKNPDDVIILTWYENQRDFIIFKRKHQLKLPIYNVKNIGINHAGNNPFFFMSDSTLSAKLYFMPMPFFSQLTLSYLNTIRERFFYEKQFD